MAKYYRRRRRVRALLTTALLTPPTPCYGDDPSYHRPVPVGWNLYRCENCAARRWPERWWHKAAWWVTRGRHDPFGRGRECSRVPWRLHR